MSQTILVTGIGGNVGQGILRNIRAAFPKLRLVGTDIRDATAGHHFCDAAHRVPYCYDDGFADRVIDICRQESVDLIIPGTDYEVVYIGELASDLPTVLGTPPDVARLFVDKLQTCHAFASVGIPFADGCLPSEYDGQFDSLIVKPREGRGSRGLHINPAAPTAFDDTCMVQQLILGKELTTAFYVTKSRDIHGHITFERELAAGATERCATTTEYDRLVEPLIEAITENFDVRGPCNVQVILTDDDRLVPFEINCRYSGTNSIRSQFGFEDVRWGIEEWLLDQLPSAWTLKPGAAIRILMDIIYPGGDLGSLPAGDDGSYLF
ncbi:MAG: ATP-grasp domain-containing protein [Planctomycetaceae bacterium]|nr:ATP-grasp domain-containing protein [Planctomycetaceae bacterium]